MIPLRLLFRNRWWALAWAAIICWQAASFVDGERNPGRVDASDSVDGNIAQAAALAAEQGD